jgi:hypothetical protein
MVLYATQPKRLTQLIRATRWRQDQVSHLQFETTVYDWQGAQITLICFDELTHSRPTMALRVACIRATRPL